MPAIVRSSPARRRATSATTTSTGSPLVRRSPASPASPSPWRSHSVRPAVAASAGGHHRAGSAASSVATRSHSDRSPTSCTCPARVGAERAQDHARLQRAVPAVALEVDHHVLRAGPRGGQRALGPAEGDATGAGAAADQREAGVLALLAHGGHVLDPGRGHQQARLGVAGAERAQARELLGRVQGQDPAGDHRVDVLHRGQVRRRERRAGVSGQGGAERVDAAGLDLQPGGHPVATEADQVLRRRRPGRRAGRTRRCCAPTRGRSRRPGR